MTFADVPAVQDQPDAVRIVIDLDGGAEPIAGRVRGPAVDERFSSWLGLLGALQLATAGARVGPSDHNPEGESR